MNQLSKILMAVFLIVSMTVTYRGQAAPPGLPLAEDFSDISLVDGLHTSAGWDSVGKSMVLADARSRFGGLSPGGAIVVSTGTNGVFASRLVDVNADGILDLVFLTDRGVSIHTGSFGTEGEWRFNTNGPSTLFSTQVVGGDPAAYFLRTGDFDNDGDIDIFAVTPAMGIFWEQTPAGFPVPPPLPTPVPVSFASARVVEFADIVGDGAQELLIADAGGTWYVPIQSGTYNSANAIPIGTQVRDVRAIAVSDIDRDGDLDVVSGVRGAANTIHMNDGFGNFTAVVEFGEGSQTQSLVVADFNRDGRADIFAGNDGENALHLGNGDGSFHAPVPMGKDLGDTVQVVADDMDGNGSLDVIEVNNNGPLNVYLTDYPFAIRAPVSIDGMPDFLLNLALADVDNDGDVDMMATNSGSDSRRLEHFVNRSRENPVAADFDVTGMLASGSIVRSGDLDGDRMLDLVVVTSAGDALVFPVDRFGNLTVWTSVASQIGDAVLGDVTGDGVLDMVSVSSSGDLLSVHGGDGKGGFPSSIEIVEPVTTGSIVINNIALGDFDNDGDLDIVSAENGPNRFWSNNGDGTFIGGVPLETLGQVTNVVLLTDVNGDGNLDVVSGNQGKDVVLMGNGNGSADSPGFDLSTDASPTSVVQAGDVNNDGIIDLYIGNSIGDDHTHLGKGDGTFEAGVPVSGTTASTNSAKLIDMNGDGWLDVVQVSIGVPGELLLGNGDGTFAPYIQVEKSAPGNTAEVSTNAMVATDIDADGAIDLVTIGDSYLLLHRNQLVRSFAEGIPVTDAGDTDTRAMALQDIDRDGDLDAIIADGGEVVRLSGDATGALVSDASLGSAGANVNAFAFGDVDHDGDLDFVAGTDSVDTYHRNNGDGTFAAPEQIGASSSATLGIFLADMGRDGVLDLVTVSRNAGAKVFLANSDGDFNTAPSAFAASLPGTVSSVAFSEHHPSEPLAHRIAIGTESGLIQVRTNVPGNPSFFGSVVGQQTSAANVHALKFADINNDSFDDLVASLGTTVCIYLNDPANPNRFFGGSSGGACQSADHVVNSSSASSNFDEVTLVDINADGKLDLLTGGLDGLLAFTGDGTGNFTEVESVTTESHGVSALAAADLNQDGAMDVVVGTVGSPDRIYLSGRRFDTNAGVVRSETVNDSSQPVGRATLSAQAVIPANTKITWSLSNDGSATWYTVRDGETFEFPVEGDDLRWRAEFESLSPVVTPILDAVAIERPVVTIPDTDENPTPSLSWTVNPGRNDTATRGRWHYRVPQESSVNGLVFQPAGEVGSPVLVTSATAGPHAEANDVDGGVTTARSNAIDIPVGTKVELSFRYFFAHDDKASERDYLKIRVVASGGPKTFTVKGAPRVRTAKWTNHALDITNFAGKRIKLVAKARDGGVDNLVEAGLTDIEIKVTP